MRLISLCRSPCCRHLRQRTTHAQRRTRGGHLAYSRLTKRLYASAPATNAIADDLGDDGGPSSTGSAREGPVRRWQFLYVGLDGAAAVARIDLLTRTVDQHFSLGSDPFFGPYFVEDMDVQPAHHDVLAVSLRNASISPRHAGVAVFENGVRRADVTQRHTGSNVIEFADAAGRLYGYNDETTEFGFRRMAVDAAGVTEVDVAASLISGFGTDIEHDAGRNLRDNRGHRRCRREGARGDGSGHPLRQRRRARLCCGRGPFPRPGRFDFDTEDVRPIESGPASVDTDT